MFATCKLAPSQWSTRSRPRRAKKHRHVQEASRQLLHVQIIYAHRNKVIQHAARVAVGVAAKKHRVPELVMYCSMAGLDCQAIGFATQNVIVQTVQPPLI